MSTIDPFMHFSKYYLALAIICLLPITGCTRQSEKADVLISDSYLLAPLFESEPNLDPSGNWSGIDIEIFGIIYDALYLFGESGNLEPGLASELPTISEDGKVYRIKLKPNVYFHDNEAFENGKGRAVTAQDVIYSIKRIAHPSNETGLFSLIQDRIDGLDEYRNSLQDGSGSFDDNIPGLTAISDTELEVRLVEPYSAIIYVLGMPSFSVVPREVVEFYNEEFKNHPVGTGPYKVTSLNDTEIVMEKIENHWRLKAFSPEGIVFRYFDDSWNAFKDGKLDLFLIKTERLKAYLNEKLEIKEALLVDGYGLYVAEEASRSFLAFNHRDQLMQNVHLRRAIAHAIPWAEIISEDDKVSGSFISDKIPGYLDLNWDYDLKKAQKELDLAGYPEGKDLPELIFRARRPMKIYQAGMVQDALAEIGIKVKVELKEIDELDYAHIGSFSWMLDFPDASSMFYLLYSKALPPEGNNYGYFENQWFDDQLKAAFNLPEAEKKIHYEQMNQWLYDNAIVIPFRRTFLYYGLSPRIVEIQADSLGYLMWTNIEMINGTSNE